MRNSSNLLAGLQFALEKIQTAIQKLDQVEAPAHIAAHLELAAHKLREAIATRSIN